MDFEFIKGNLQLKVIIGKLIFGVLYILCAGSILNAQTNATTLSGLVKDKQTKSPLPFVNVVVLVKPDSAFVSGTVSNEEGRFLISNIKPGDYVLQLSLIGYHTKKQDLFIGSLSAFLDLATIEIDEETQVLNEVTVTAKQDEIGGKMEKKIFSIDDNISQKGGSVLQALQNLPGITVENGKILLRGNDKVTVLIEGKQTALTGFGNQSGLDNLPASMVDKIEVINNPSSKYDANGNAGILNIIYKKNEQDGVNGKIGFSTGLGALWIRKENFPTIRPQYQATPKINPSLALNYRKKHINLFVQADDLYTHTLNKNEFVTRSYSDGTVIRQQLKRNRNTNFLNVKSGIDWAINPRNTLTLSGFLGSEKIIDRGDQPFFNSMLDDRKRLWQFLEDELKTTAMAILAYQYKFKQAGQLLNLGYNYTYHRENEKYFFDNILPTYNGQDAFKLLSDEHVSDLNADFINPLKSGRLETGLKLRIRDIPTHMQFFPGINSPLDVRAGGKATYREIIPAWYGNYIFENKRYEAEIGLRLEYVDLQYQVNPDHPTYTSDGYQYIQPFPNLRLAWKINDQNKLSVFYNRRVDRPNEVDIRIFPKYDDAEIIKVGNPALRPQFTNSIELGYKSSWTHGYVYAAAYHRFANGTITRISTIVPGSTLIYAIFQNAGKSFNTGLEMAYAQNITSWYSFLVNINGYRNQINAFTIENKYPVPHPFSAVQQEITSGSIKWNNSFHLPDGIDAQLSLTYLAPDLIPQGKIFSRFSMDLGIKKILQKGRGEFFLNATDLLNTLVIKKEIQGNNFNYVSRDYYETQVFRIGYSIKF